MKPATAILCVFSPGLIATLHMQLAKAGMKHPPDPPKNVRDQNPGSHQGQPRDKHIVRPVYIFDVVVIEKAVNEEDIARVPAQETQYLLHHRIRKILEGNKRNERGACSHQYLGQSQPIVSAVFVIDMDT